MESWHTKGTLPILEALSSNVERGLSNAGVARAREQYGPNELPSKRPPNTIELIVRQLKSPLVYILLIAAVLSIAVHEIFDAVVILISVLINTVLGFAQESKASHALEELKALVHTEAKVRRDGHIRMVDATQLVPGDILIVETGARISADARLISTVNLEVNEAALTGESLPVKKDADADVEEGTISSEQLNMLFMGTTIVSGRAEAIVVETGIHTVLGQTAKLVQDIDETTTPLQEQLKRFADLIAIGVLLIGAGLVAYGISAGYTFVEMITLTAAIAVSAIPEGLLVAMTVILAVGMRRILKQHALVKRLVAAETLGSVSIICTDKTGTITEGKMQVTHVSVAAGIFSHTDEDLLSHPDVKELLHIVTLNNDAQMDGKEIIGQSLTERAILAFASGLGIQKPDLDTKHARVAEVPFSSVQKFMMTLHEWKGSAKRLLIKGAPEILLERSTHVLVDGVRKKLTKELRATVRKNIESMTEEGLRLIACGYTSHREASLSGEENGFTLVGVIGLSDPPRQQAIDIIRGAHGAGVRTILITGDHPKTARFVASSVGITASGGEVLTGEELDGLSDDEFKKKLSSISVYARVLPSHKVRIVQAWRERGANVAMIGDGVNDAPAIKAADIGVAVGSGTEVAKQTSDMILLDDNLGTLVRAIRQGRVIFDNIRKVVVYLLADAFSEIILIIGALLMGLPLPILPAQILWINLVTDGFPYIALTFEPGEKGIMKEPPRRRKEPIINGEMKSLIFIIGVFTDIGLFAIYFFLLSRGLPIEEIRTFIFVALGIDSLLYIFSIRSFRTSIFKTNFFQNPMLILGVFVGAIMLVLPLTIPFLQNLFEFVPLTLTEWTILFGIAIVKVLMIELVKSIYNAIKKRSYLKANYEPIIT